MAGHLPVQPISHCQALPSLQTERIMVIKEDVALVSLKDPHTLNEAVNTMRLMQLPDGSFLDARATSDRIMARHAHWEAQVTTASCSLLHDVNLDGEAAVTCILALAAQQPTAGAGQLLPVNRRLEQSQPCCCAGGCTDQKDAGA